MARDADKIPRCNATVFRRDTYRRTGRGPSGFEMHYAEGQCKRRAVNDGRCKQHARGNGVNVSDCRFAHEFIGDLK